MLILSNRQHLAGLEGFLAAVSSLGNGGAVITLFNRARVCYNETDKRGD